MLVWLCKSGECLETPNPIPPLSTLLINILAIMLGDDMVVVGSTLCVIEVNLIPTRIISCNVGDEDSFHRAWLHF